jgi:hypothetical protein
VAIVDDVASLSDVDKLCSLLKSVASDVAWVEHQLQQPTPDVGKLREDFRAKELDIYACLKLHATVYARLFPTAVTEAPIIALQEDTNNEQRLSEDHATEKKTLVTEVFENFTILQSEPQQTGVKSKPVRTVEECDVAYQPPISFLAELQEKMQARKQALESTDKVCFKEFDVTLNKFVMVSREEREIKQRQLE